MLRRPPRSTRTDTLFPYPTLFRSRTVRGCVWIRGVLARAVRWPAAVRAPAHGQRGRRSRHSPGKPHPPSALSRDRASVVLEAAAVPYRHQRYGRTVPPRECAAGGPARATGGNENRVWRPSTGGPRSEEHTTELQ